MSIHRDGMVLEYFVIQIRLKSNQLTEIFTFEEANRRAGVVCMLSYVIKWGIFVVFLFFYSRMRFTDRYHELYRDLETGKGKHLHRL